VPIGSDRFSFSRLLLKRPLTSARNTLLGRAFGDIPIFVELLHVVAQFVVIVATQDHFVQALAVVLYGSRHGVFFVVPGAFVGLVV